MNPQVPLPPCAHEKLPLTPVVFDEVAAHGMTVDEVRRVYPRVTETCPDCGTTVVLYTSFEHYIAGDW